jgi:signal peptidase I
MEINEVKKPKLLSKELIGWVKAFLIALIVAILVRTFLFAPVYVDGESMMPTLNHGDRMIMNKLASLNRFDIVVFKEDETEDYIKRIIGLPGDTLHYENDVLYINGKSYKEKYLDVYKAELTDGLLTGDFTLEGVTGLSIVPPDHYFVLGDNRRVSKDSRSTSVGFVSKEQIMGTTSFVYWPLSNLHFVN